jgi:hypothetical protein
LHLFLQINKFHSCSYLFSPDNSTTSLVADKKRQLEDNKLLQESFKEKMDRDKEEHIEMT